MTGNETRWDPAAGGSLGRPVRRAGDLELVTGKGSYVGDLVSDTTLHARFVRSPVAHGRLVSVEAEAARDLPGVVGVFTVDDLEVNDLPPPHGVDRPDVARPPLARDRVRYVGEPVAVVVADDAVTAADAADMVWLEIDDLPVVLDTDPDTADGGDPLFDGTNVLVRETTQPIHRVLDDLPIAVTVDVRNQRLAAVAIEGLAFLCEPLDSGRLLVHCGHQAPHRLKTQLAHTLGLDPPSVQVIVPDVGGAFGLKGMFFTEYVVVAAVALRLNKPVMWLEERREHLTAGMHGRDQRHTVTLEGDQSGRVRRARIRIAADVGAYPQGGAIIPTLSRFVATGLYDIEEVSVDLSIVVTNRAPTASYRGAGRPEAAFAIERAMEEFAVAVGMDPAEVRRINFIKPSQLPYRNATGALYDSGDYVAALDRGLELVDVAAVRREQRQRLSQGQDPVGLGIGAFVERTGGAADSGEFGDVEITQDGKVVVRTGSTDSGQGHSTVWAQAVADVFDLDPASVTVIAGDTDEVHDGVGTFASRSAQVGASAVYRMALLVRERAREVAADLLEASPHDIEVSGGGLGVVGVPGSSLGLAEIAGHAVEMGVELRSEEMFVPGTQAFPYGAHVAVVEVELETGLVRVRRLVSVDDCGHVLNPMIVAGQMHGSLVQGFGQAMLEGVVYDGNGVPLTTTLMDYLIPSAGTIPPMTTDRLVTPAPNNPLGVKGTGEAGCIGVPPAIVNATLDALRPYGVTSLDMPLTPARVWAALAAQRSSSKS